MSTTARPDDGTAFIIASGMAERINSTPLFDGVEAIVDRQLDIETEVAKRVGLSRSAATGKGACITIFYSGFTNPDASAAIYSKIVRTYLVSVYGVQVRKTGHMPVDRLMEEAGRTLHNWEPAEQYGIAEIHVLNGLSRPDSDYLIYDLEVRVLGRI